MIPVRSLMRNPQVEEIEWLEPWHAVAEGSALEAELAREVCDGHPLRGHMVRAVGRRADSDDVLYFLPGHEFAFAVVHLTWAKESRPGWPATDFYSSADDWVERCMRPDHLDAE